MNYYNEHDPGAAHWLRSLIAAGLIPDGHVDTRSIEDVKADELRGYNQCHFFAGIGGWPRALQLAGVPDDVRLWTGSCPCQPLSVAGKRKGEQDERHLWPVWYRLIRDVSPPVIFGEQAGESDGLEWLTGVRLDLDELGYAVGAASLPAASVGAPHRRYRYFFVADAGKARRESTEHEILSGSPSKNSGMGNADTERQREEGACISGCGSTWASSAGHWEDFELIGFTDGKTRRLKPGTLCLVDGLPGRVAQLRGLGNAIVPQVAALFIRAWLESAENSACTDGDSE